MGACATLEIPDSAFGSRSPVEKVYLCFSQMNSRSCFTFDGVTLNENALTDSKYQHSETALAKFSNTIVGIGGFNNHTERYQNSQWVTMGRERLKLNFKITVIFDCLHFQSKIRLPKVEQIRRFSVVSMDDMIYVFGGVISQNSSISISSLVFRYDNGPSGWSIDASLLSRRQDHISFFVEIPSVKCLADQTDRKDFKIFDT